LLELAAFLTRKAYGEIDCSIEIVERRQHLRCDIRYLILKRLPALAFDTRLVIGEVLRTPLCVSEQLITFVFDPDELFFE
jgi:hypothetical protein